MCPLLYPILLLLTMESLMLEETPQTPKSDPSPLPPCPLTISPRLWDTPRDCGSPPSPGSCAAASPLLGGKTFSQHPAPWNCSSCLCRREPPVDSAPCVGCPHPLSLPAGTAAGRARAPAGRRPPPSTTRSCCSTSTRSRASTWKCGTSGRGGQSSRSDAWCSEHGDEGTRTRARGRRRRRCF